MKATRAIVSRTQAKQMSTYRARGSGTIFTLSPRSASSIISRLPPQSWLPASSPSPLLPSIHAYSISRIRSYAAPSRGPIKPPTSAHSSFETAAAADSTSSSSVSSSPSSPKPKSRRPRRPLRFYLGVGLAGSALIFLIDEYVNSRTLQRNLRTAYVGAMIALDYKLNFDTGDADAINGLHERCADRLFRTCEANQGLYIKMGQAVGANSMVLPPAYHRFTKLFDDVERMPWSVAKQVIEEELATKGQTMDQVFSTIDEAPIAAASVAQVHKATMRSTGQQVAVKVQRPQIRKQAYWDLLSFRILLRFYQAWFNLPLAYFGKYISDQIELETHFNVELKNAQRIQKHILADPSVNQTVNVPTCLPEVSSDRLLVMDWIEGAVKLTDTVNIEEMGLSIKKIASDVCNVFSAMIFQYGHVQADGHSGNILVRKHPNGKKGQHQVVLIDHGLYVTLSDDFRRKYAQLWKAIFMFDLSTLRSITEEWGMGGESSELLASATLMRPWSAKQKHKGSDRSGSDDEKDRSPAADRRRHAARMQRQKDLIQNFLVKVELVPKELIFVGRSMRIVQANNQTLGSPVNRINILARHAADALIGTNQVGSLWRVFFPPRLHRDASSSSSSSSSDPDPSTEQRTLQNRFHTWFFSRLSFLRFRTTLLVLDGLFLLSSLRWFIADVLDDPRGYIGLGGGSGSASGSSNSQGSSGTGKGGENRKRRRGGFEDDMEKSMQRMAKEELGVDLRSDAFD